MSNVIQFPGGAPRRMFNVKVYLPGGKIATKQAETKRASMDLILEALQEFPDARRISVFREENFQ
jgi:hypothetical protein